MKHLVYRIVCGWLLLGAANLVQAQAPCRKFVQASAVSRHQLAIANDGTLWAWGKNEAGQLGDGTTTNRDIPVQVGTDRNWKQVRAGEYHSLGVKTNGTLWAWGDNRHGALGLGHTTNQSTPVQVGTDTDWDLSGFGMGSGAGFSIVTKTDGSLWFFGINDYYQSGLSEEAPYNIPYVEEYLTPVEAGGGTRDWKVVSLGPAHTVAIKTDGTLWGWGANGHRIGHGAPADLVKAPYQLGTDTDWKTVAAGDYFSLSLKNDGTLWVWGDNDYGQLGNGVASHDDQEVAIQVGTDRDWKMVAAGCNTTLALKNDGSLWAWGRGGLGDGTRTDRAVPTRVGESKDWVSVTAGYETVTALRSDGSLWTWGMGGSVDHLYPTRVYSPAFIPGIGRQGDAEVLHPTDQWHYFEKDCRLICRVRQTNNWGDGVRATGNSITARVWVDGSELFGWVYDDRLRRHYQITPALNSETTTGQVSLYFTQEEFDEFNAVATNLKKLPTEPDDAAGIANLRVEKRGGVSVDGSGKPAGYPGTAATIDPADEDIQWDATNGRWEVTFDVTGFGGFWVKTTGLPLPATFGGITAWLKGGSLLVNWTAEKETNNSRYEIEVSADGKTFRKIGELGSKAVDGNSDTAIEYRFQTPSVGLLGAVGIAGVGLVLLAFTAGFGGKRPRKRLLPLVIIAMTLLGAAACSKTSKDAIAGGTQKIWVRIIQVYKDGARQYSKIVQVITED